MTEIELVKIDNPYWEEVKDLPQADPLFASEGQRMLARWPRDEHGNFQFDVTYSRDDLVSKYSWTVPSPEAIAFVTGHLNGRPVIELGAGTGYWAYLLGQHGIDVKCFDNNPVRDGENYYHPTERGAHEWVPIKKGGVEVLRDPANAGRVLFLSWPPYDNSMAYDALKAFRGDTLVYIGEGDSGCTGDDAFHALLASEWEIVETFCPVQWEGLHDYIFIYERW